MTVKENRELRKAFLKHPFEHSRDMEKETVFNGITTGDKVCTICGLTSFEIEQEEELKGITDKWCK
ncbi:MAG: hypothetical protein ACHP9Y_03295 [Gammaproteobacteria bacterium]